jgi:hypothetical protein
MAALMLEELVCELSGTRSVEVRAVLVLLGVQQESEAEVSEWLAAEGFTDCTPAGFFAQLQHKLQRLPLKPRASRNEREWAWWLRRSTQECRLCLARYLLQPEEVVQRALSQIRISQGTPDSSVAELPALSDPQTLSAYDARPYEAAILALLATQGSIYWVSERTSSAPNSLVEYPVGTVVLTIKPPGSDLEIEIKRAGMRNRLLGVVYEREGVPVPIPHRLQGGSMGSTLQWEARKSLDLSVFYSAATGRPAPMSRMISLTTVRTIPVQGGEAFLTEYFTDPGVFGQGFSQMRSEMGKAVAATNPSSEGLGGLALTVDFMRAMKPKQAILAGTSSFRLDKVRDCLTAAAPSPDFEYGQVRDLLEQVLGMVVHPGGGRHESGHFVAAALDVPANRIRADRAFLRSVAALASFCGALWSIGGYSNGESIAERNVGILRRWESGEWVVSAVSMDHDGLILPGPGIRNFRPQAALGGMKADERYLFGRLIGHRTIRGSIPCLRDIYRVSPAIEAESECIFRDEFARSCQAMRRAMMPRGRLRRYIPERYIQQLFDFQELAERFFANRQARKTWEGEARATLRAKEYHPERVDEFVDAIQGEAAFLTRHPALYEGANRALSRS